MFPHAYYCIMFLLINHIGYSAGRGVGSGTQAGTEARLVAALVGEQSGYSMHAIPMHNQSTPVTLKLDMALNFIEGLDEEKQLLYINCWLRLDWVDINLKWNSEDYGGIGDVRIPPSKLWTPDINVYNSHSFTVYGSSDERTAISAVVLEDGRVYWVPQVRIVTPCPLDLTHFPFDTQRCSIQFGSWTHSAMQLNLTLVPHSAKLFENYPTGQAFQLSNSAVKRNVMRYKSLPEDYVDIVYTLELTRASSYSTHLVIAPTAALCLVLPGVFLLPTASKQKLVLGTGLLITEAVMLVVLTDMLPRGHPTMPRLGIYHITTLILIVISLALSACVSYIWDKGALGKAMPAFLDKVVSVLARPLWISRESVTAVGSYNQLELSTEAGGADDRAQMIPEKQSAGESWRLLAAILDRFCFLLFTVVCLVCSLVFAFA